MKIDDLIGNIKDQFDEPESMNLTPMSNFKEVEEWDSIVAISVIAMADSEYGIKLTGEDIRNSKTINDLYIIMKGRC